MKLNNIRIVLIEISHPGNIGAAARAMKTMGLSDLCLVKPKKFPSGKATAMASGANSVLDNATVVDSLQEAVSDCQMVIGTSARTQRYVRWPIMSARECGEYVMRECKGQNVAIVFGRERYGLTNEELECCHSLVNVPVDPEFSSLNVASAVQILSYECSMAASIFTASRTQTAQDADQNNIKRSEQLVNAREMEGYFEHLEQTLIDVEYLDPDKPRLLMRRLRRLYGRLQITRSELNILLGILSACQGRKYTRNDE